MAAKCCTHTPFFFHKITQRTPQIAISELGIKERKLNSFKNQTLRLNNSEVVPFNAESKPI
jgi:hypothetical protein